MARMSEQDALKNIVRFSDPRLHRVGFGINLTIFNPKEKTVLIYLMGDVDGMNQGSVIPLDDLQSLTLDEFCILGNRVYAVMMHIFGYHDLGDHLRIIDGRLEAYHHYHDHQWRWDSVSIYHIIGRMNGIIGFLQQHMSQKELGKLVWSEITH